MKIFKMSTRMTAVFALMMFTVSSWGASNSPIVSLSCSPNPVTEGGSGNLTAVTCQVSINVAPDGKNIELTIKTTDVTTTENSDYQLLSQPVLFEKDTTTLFQNFTINVIGDAAIEPNETFKVSVIDNGTNSSQDFTLPADATMTINNDDVAPAETPPTFSGTISNQSGIVGTPFIIDLSTYFTETNGDPITYSDSGNLPVGITINPTTGVLSGIPSTAGSYTNIIITGTDNDGAANSNSFTVTIAAVSIPSASVASASITEGNSGTSILNFTVTLDAAAPAGGVTLNYETSDGTAVSTVNGDYVSNSGTVTIAAGDTIGTISVTINGDTTVEPNETFSVTLSSPTNATLGTATAIGTIIDDDACSATTLLQAYNNGDTNTTTGAVTSGNSDYYAIYIDTNGTLEVDLTNTTVSKALLFDFKQNCSLLFDTVNDTTSTLDGGKNVTAYIAVTQGWYYIGLKGVHASQPTSYDLTVTFIIQGGNGAESYVNANVGVNDSGINYDVEKNITTKIVEKPFGIRTSYLDENGFVATYDGTFSNNKTVDMSVILSLATDSCQQLNVISDGIIAHDTSYTEISDIIINTASKKRRFSMTSFDFGNLFRNATGLNCASSSLQSSLCLVPACFNSVDNIRAVFPPAFYPAVLTCVNGDGGGIAPCDSLAYYGSCGGKKESAVISPSIYNHNLGCAACLADAIQGEPCSKDNFAIRPDKFDVNITNGTTFKAAKEENLLFRAPNYNDNPSSDYNDTQDILTDGTTFYVDLNVSNSSACQIKNLTITPNVSFVDGIHQDNFSFNDIGDINMSIHETNGTEFAIVDNDDTPLADRLIQEYNVSFTVIPDHFYIDANLTDHNSDNNFTYLHDINRYDNDDNYSMGAALTIDIKAMGADENITRNYMETCYAKDTNLTLSLAGTDITFPGSVAPLTYFLYYNPVEDNGTSNSGEGNYSLPAAGGNTISITSLPIENVPSTFPADAPDGNGTTHIEYKLNFDRKQHLAVNPFRMLLSDVNITETNTSDPVEGATGSLSDQNATLYYARTRSSQFFYDDITDDNVTTPILIDVYCDLGFTACDNLGIDTVNGQINEMNWWLSWNHNATNGDGNITLRTGSTEVIEGVGAPTVTPTNVQIVAGAKNENVIVTSNATTLPMTAEIELVRESDIPTPPIYTNEWLIYNPYDAILTSSPFYKVRFIGQSGWAGHGDTGHVVDSNVSTKKNRRLGW